MPNLIINGSHLGVRREARRLILQRPKDDLHEAKSLTVPLTDVERVTVVGHPGIPVSVFQRLMRENIPVSFVSEKGRFYGTLHTDSDLNAARRILQYDQYNQPEARLKCARKIITSKLRNQRRVLQRLAANRALTERVKQVSALDQLKQYRRQAGQAGSLDTLRGIEGQAAALYFDRLARFFPENTPFNGRSRRPPRDPANALLSWTYTIVRSEIDVALRLHGLDPGLGCLHEISPGTPALSLDLLEPLRAPVCDLLVLSIFNHSILKPNDFHRTVEDGGTYLNEDAKKQFFFTYESHITRKFKMEPGANHTDLRQQLTRHVWTTLRLLENPDDPSAKFFHMP